MILFTNEMPKSVIGIGKWLVNSLSVQSRRADPAWKQKPIFDLLSNKIIITGD